MLPIQTDGTLRFCVMTRGPGGARIRSKCAKSNIASRIASPAVDKTFRLQHTQGKVLGKQTWQFDKFLTLQRNVLEIKWLSSGNKVPLHSTVYEDPREVTHSPFHSLTLDVLFIMALISISWHSITSLFLLSLFAFSIDALPKKKAASSSTASTTGISAAAAGGITTATDGSVILDKTVTIK